MRNFLIILKSAGKLTHIHYHNNRLGTSPVIHEGKDRATIGVHDLVLNKTCSVFNNNNYEKIFVSIEFLNSPLKEIETPFSLPKEKPYTKYRFNFVKGNTGICLFTKTCSAFFLFNQKDYWMHDPEQKHQLTELVGPHSSGEYVTICFISFLNTKENFDLFYIRIRFVVVAEPSVGKQTLDCIDIGYASVNAKQLLRDAADYRTKSIDGKKIYHTSDLKPIGQTGPTAMSYCLVFRLIKTMQTHAFVLLLSIFSRHQIRHYVSSLNYILSFYFHQFSPLIQCMRQTMKDKSSVR